MSVTLFKDGVRIGDRELPRDIADKANDVRVWMMINGVEHLCGLTQSLDAHLKIGALEHEIKQLKAQLRKGEN
jgi:hypothetical protein